MTYRILVTASREWSDRNVMERVLRQAAEIVKLYGRNPKHELVLVHGDARGGDRMARNLWRHWGYTDEPHPAAWAAPCRPTCKDGHRRHDGMICPAAGFYRSEEMVDSGVDVCIAFIHKYSRGATHCASYAQKKGVKTTIYRED